MAQSIQGKTALITGAARRIGRETAVTLAQEGAQIIVHYHTSLGPAEELAREVRGYGVQAWTLQADFANAEATTSLIERALNLAGSLDILINNASIFPADTLDTVSESSLMQNMAVNAWAPFVLSRDFARLAHRGVIVNLLDSRLVGYEWTHVGYILSKHALAVLTRMAALQYAPDIRVNGVGPGLILPPPGRPDSYLERMAPTVPLKRHGDPQDIADAIAFLVRSEFITGEVINVDGGRHLWEYVSGPHPG